MRVRSASSKRRVSAKWILFLCVSSFGLGLLFTNRYDYGIHAYLYIKAILEGKEAMDIEALQRESKMLRAGLAAQIICEGRELRSWD
ncbi:uncharacterized protein A4U43_C05F23030 [Asparagus officinalis]|uniref:DUF4094 domain-containing protein n=1 Tax=Asparagus officinalis TaxID=4686 RepID=A0A5P1ETZ2_ASPOF|nr:uncharacterized protein A4U43_C05F23030 [Asparagus officinalis]